MIFLVCSLLFWLQSFMNLLIILSTYIYKKPWSKNDVILSEDSPDMKWITNNPKCISDKFEKQCWRFYFSFFQFSFCRAEVTLDWQDLVKLFPLSLLLLYKSFKLPLLHKNYQALNWNLRKSGRNPSRK